MPDAIEKFRAELGPHAVLAAGQDLRDYEEGARYDRGCARAVLRPATTEGVSAALRIAVEEGLTLIAQGANTGVLLQKSALEGFTSRIR